MIVVQLANSKVAASWTRIFFLDEHVAWIWAVGSFGGHRRAVTAGHRRGPGGG